MTADKFDVFLSHQIQAIKLLLANRLITQSLILLYSAIDILGSIVGNSDSASGDRFKSFVSEYMVKDLGGVTADDLWGARCGLIHANSPESDHSKRKKARQILYSRGKAPHEIAQEIIRRKEGEGDYVALKIECLVDAFVRGAEDLKRKMDGDVAMKELVSSRINAAFYSQLVL